MTDFLSVFINNLCYFYLCLNNSNANKIIKKMMCGTKDFIDY